MLMTGLRFGFTGLVMRCMRSEEHTSELQSRFDLVCRLLLEKKMAVAGGIVGRDPIGDDQHGDSGHRHGYQASRISPAMLLLDAEHLQTRDRSGILRTRCQRRRQGTKTGLDFVERRGIHLGSSIDRDISWRRSASRPRNRSCLAAVSLQRMTRATSAIARSST